MSLLSKHEKLKIKRKEDFKAKFCKNQNLAFNLDKKRLSNMIDCSICLVVYSKNTLLIYVLKIGTLFTWGKLHLSPVTTSIKNKCKFVFLLTLYVSLLLKHKKLKNQKKKRSKS